jgi:MOSC domain-containing protein YiiM
VTGSVISVNLAVPRGNPGRRSGGPEQTGIDKRPVQGPVRAHPLGLDGDRIFDGKNHGGPDQAVYAYAGERSLAGKLLQAPQLPEPLRAEAARWLASASGRN